MKHTKGPWKYRRTHSLSSDYWYVIVDSDGCGPIMEVGGKDMGGQIAEAKYLITDPGVIEANAKLISAAPELGEGLIHAIYRNHNYSETCDGCRKGRPALKKAGLL